MWVAAVGSFLIAVGLLMPTCLVIFAVVTEFLKAIGVSLFQSLTVLTFGSIPLGLIGTGYFLLVGYWRIAMSRASGSRRVAFWRLSAGYNALGLALMIGAFLVEVIDGNMGIPVILSFPAICWTGFMVNLGLVRSRRAGASAASS